MATRSIANRNNFIRWDKINGTYPESLLETFKLPPFNTPPFDLSGAAYTNESFDIDISNVTVNTFDVSGQIDNVSGIFFRTDGLKFYACRQNLFTANNFVYEYDMSTAWDLTTASYSGNSFQVNIQTQDCEDVSFRDNGDNMFVVGGNEDQIFDYSLSTAWDVSTASYTGNSLNVNAQETNITAAHFRENGTQLFIIGTSSDTVFRYELSSAWDLTTASYTGNNFNASAQIGLPTSVYLNPSGTLMYIVNSSDNTVYQYSMTTPFDLSTASYDNQSYDLTGEDSGVKGLLFKPDGLQMYTSGRQGAQDTIYEYLLDSAFQLPNTENESNPTGIVFGNFGTKMLISGNGSDQVRGYDLSIAFDITTANYANEFFGVSTQDNDLQGIAFTDDGLTMFALGNQNNNIYQYSLSTPWDVLTASYTSNSFSVAGQTSAPVGLYITDTNMYVCSETIVYQYVADLENIGNSVYTNQSFNFSSQENSARDIYISDDGESFFVLGLQNDTIYKYVMTSIFDVSTCIYLSENFSVGTQEPAATTFTFQNSGASFFALGQTNTTVYKYNTSSFVDVQEYGNESQYEQVEKLAVTLLPNDVLSFYANLDTLETNANFGSWSLNLVFADSFGLAASNIASLTQDVISGSDYRFYLNQFTIPSNIAIDCYRLVIVDTTDSQVLYISNSFKIGSKIAAYTSSIQYRNDIDILNFNYEGLPSYKNQFRIDLVVRNPIFSVNRIGYDLVNGSFNPVRTVKGKNKECITEAYDEFDHEAWNAATIHSELDIFEEGAFRRYDRGESDYTIEWQINYPLADGTIVLERRDSYSSNKNV